MLATPRRETVGLVVAGGVFRDVEEVEGEVGGDGRSECV